MVFSDFKWACLGGLTQLILSHFSIDVLGSNKLPVKMWESGVKRKA